MDFAHECLANCELVHNSSTEWREDILFSIHCPTRCFHHAGAAQQMGYDILERHGAEHFCGEIMTLFAKVKSQL